jgi:chemotaxis protein CheC
MVGVHLVISGGLHGQAILILPVTSALNLVDLLMGDPPGTATGLGVMEQSALSEIGNMTVSYFLNGVAALSRVPGMLQPSPPTVMVNVLAAMISAIVTPVSTVRDDLLIIETDFQDAAGTVQSRLWVLPDQAIRDLG